MTAIASLAKPLTPRQMAAAGLLAAGSSFSDVAAALNFSRSAITKWKKVPAFLDAIEAERRRIWQAGGDRLRAAVPKAITALEAVLDNSASDTLRVDAATAVLKAAGPIPSPDGKTPGMSVNVDVTQHVAATAAVQMIPLPKGEPAPKNYVERISLDGSDPFAGAAPGSIRLPNGTVLIPDSDGRLGELLRNPMFSALSGNGHESLKSAPCGAA